MGDQISQMEREGVEMLMVNYDQASDEQNAISAFLQTNISASLSQHYSASSNHGSEALAALEKAGLQRHAAWQIYSKCSALVKAQRTSTYEFQDLARNESILWELAGKREVTLGSSFVNRRGDGRCKVSACATTKQIWPTIGSNLSSIFGYLSSCENETKLQEWQRGQHTE
eukprot:CAMPEP_0183369076 /NCGR_PEP_ID=MMETSP0164_2-20130417/98209_1 /TAXON_ID=221442 /ORGANISM="Coccolithus pelagicus ssp braarudi, Strain PLY182g" /LENGTH=170 /DNA_ID=CAMNT_0025545275 /DNA_START=14 /DNA_END=526 /DNA_ORIENTATION=+